MAASRTPSSGDNAQIMPSSSAALPDVEQHVQHRNAFRLFSGTVSTVNTNYTNRDDSLNLPGGLHRSFSVAANAISVNTDSSSANPSASSSDGLHRSVSLAHGTATSASANRGHFTSHKPTSLDEVKRNRINFVISRNNFFSKNVLGGMGDYPVIRPAGELLNQPSVVSIPVSPANNSNGDNNDKGCAASSNEGNIRTKKPDFHQDFVDADSDEGHYYPPLDFLTSCHGSSLLANSEAIVESELEAPDDHHHLDNNNECDTLSADVGRLQTVLQTSHNILVDIDFTRQQELHRKSSISPKCEDSVPSEHPNCNIPASGNTDENSNLIHEVNMANKSVSTATSVINCNSYGSSSPVATCTTPPPLLQTSLEADSRLNAEPEQHEHHLGITECDDVILDATVNALSSDTCDNSCVGTSTADLESVSQSQEIQVDHEIFDTNLQHYNNDLHSASMNDLDINEIHQTEAKSQIRVVSTKHSKQLTKSLTLLHAGQNSLAKSKSLNRQTNVSFDMSNSSAGSCDGSKANKGEPSNGASSHVLGFLRELYRSTRGKKTRSLSTSSVADLQQALCSDDGLETANGRNGELVTTVAPNDAGCSNKRQYETAAGKRKTSFMQAADSCTSLSSGHNSADDTIDSQEVNSSHTSRMSALPPTGKNKLTRERRSSPLIMHRLARGRDKILNKLDIRSTSEDKGTSRTDLPEIVIIRSTAVGGTTDIGSRRTSLPKVHKS